MNDNFYVYEYVRLDTNEPFYIGKGKDNRWKDFKNKRNIKISIPEGKFVEIIESL